MKIKTWQIIATIICLIMGTILHFTFDLSGENIIIGLFSAVNESTWEHLKLIFYPMILIGIIGYFVIGKRTNNYWLAQTLGILTAIIFTIVAFYTYSGIIGTNFAWVNIAIFICSILLGMYISYKILISVRTYKAESVSIILLIIVSFNFVLYTFYTPHIALFKDPVSETYGIQSI